MPGLALVHDEPLPFSDLPMGERIMNNVFGLHSAALCPLRDLPFMLQGTVNPYIVWRHLGVTFIFRTNAQCWHHPIICKNLRPKSNEAVVYEPNPTHEEKVKECMEMTGPGTMEHVAWISHFEGAA